MKKINHNELKFVLKHNAKQNKAVGVLGRTGIGKSWVIKEVAQELAKELGRKFVEWNNLSLEEKRKVVEGGEDYYVFVDFRLSQITPEDLRGLPKLGDKGVEWKPNLWALALNKNAGCLFFDEFNLALPSIQATIYQILLDRQIGEIPLHADVFVVLAGNVLEDKAGTYDIPKPIRTRISLFELQIPNEEELIDFGIKHNWDSRVLAFLKTRPSYVFKEKNEDVISPRGWHFVSDLIKGKEDLEEIELLASGILGEGGAIEFVSFVKLREKIPDVWEILEGKKEIPDEIDLKYAVISEIVEAYRKHDKKREEIIKKIFRNIEGTLEAEFFVFLLRTVKGIDVDFLSFNPA